MLRGCLRVLAQVALVALVGCGGGGGDGGSAQSPLGPGAVSVTFSPASLSASSVEGEVVNLPFRAEISYSGSGGLYLGLEDAKGVVADVQASVSGNALAGTIILSQLPPGIHDTDLVLHACADQACSREVGSGFRLPIRHEVLANIAVPASITLRRAGREPAPQATVPVTVPGPAGVVRMTVQNISGGVFNTAFDGQQLQVQTRQERAGTYRAQVQLQGDADPRYRRVVDIEYVVEAPPEGEQGLSVSQGFFHVALAQGAATTRTFKVLRPTWTDVFAPPVLRNADGVLALRDLGNDEYEVTLDASGKQPRLYFGGITFDAGVTGGSAEVNFSIDVSTAVRLPSALGVTLRLQSQAADLHLSTPVLTEDGVPARWTARTESPWVRLLSTAGTTGVDELVFEIDPLALPFEWVPEARIDVSIDRPGTLPQSLGVPVRTEIPRLRVPGARAMVGSSGRLYVEGIIPGLHFVPVVNSLKVEGARLVAAATVCDSRFLGDVCALRVDLADMVAGGDITVGVDSALLPSQIRVTAEAPTRVPAGYVPLPYGSYRPPQYAPGRDAVYFAGPDSVYRWSHDAAAWHLDTAAVPGLIDVALRPDEQVLYAISGSTSVHALDPVSLLQTGSTALHSEGAIGFDATFDAAAPAGQRALAFSADLRAFASKTSGSGEWAQSGVDWLKPLQPVDLMQSPRWGGPGSAMLQTGTGPVRASSIVRSPAGQALVVRFPDGRQALYQLGFRSFSDYTKLPADVLLSAVADDGFWSVGSDGVLRGGFANVALASLVPATHVAGGYGITGDGRYALIYGYRIAQENGVERARDATLWVMDVNRLSVQPQDPAALVAAVPLIDAVGCTIAPVAGEACLHSAQVVAAEGGGSVFVIGPRGLAAVPMPDAMATRAKAAGAPKVRPAGPGQRFPVRGVVEGRPTGP